MNRITFLSGLIFLVFLASIGWTNLDGIPKMINYQGMLTQSNGTTPVTNGNYNLTFKIYGSEAGVDSLWREYHSNVPVTNGLLNVILGSITTLNLTFDTDYWLGIKVGTDPELSPRIRLASVGYAYRAQWADTADHAKSVDYAPLNSQYVNEGQTNSITSAMIQDYTIVRDDIAANFKAPYSDTADYALSAPAGPGDYTWRFRITDTADTSITTGGRWGISRYGNTLYGNADSTHVNLGVACTTGRSGSDYKYCTVGGGDHNAASGYWATVGGGISNTASGNQSTVGGGQDNIASGWLSTVGGGYGNFTSGEYSVIPGGFRDTLGTSGDFSMIFGRSVYIDNSYRVVFFNGSYSGRLGINRDDRDGGISHPIHVGTNNTNGNGAHLTATGVWTDASSREVKENFQKIDGCEILDKLKSLNVRRWQYKGTDEHHIGPVAEDFYNIFGVGTDNKYLASLDASGVALRVLQEVIARLEAQQKKIELLENKIEELEK